MKRQSILVLLITISLSVAASAALATGDCTDYTDLTDLELPITVSGTTVGASEDYTPFDSNSPPPDCWEGHWTWGCASGPDVTYKWTAPADGWYAISLVGSLYNADLLLYNFTCPVEPEYPDDFICGSHSVLQSDGLVTDLWLADGQELLIVVDGYGQQSGEYYLEIFDTNQLNDYLPFLMDAFHLPGLTTAVIRNGSLLWSGEYGMASLDPENESAVADSTLFLTMSACKPITGTALMQAWEDGLLDLDEDVSGDLPFNLYHPDYPDIPITFRMVMCHVAGIGDPGLGTHIVYGEDCPLSLEDFIIGYLSPFGIYYDPDASFTNHAPGTHYAYSSVGIALLGYLTGRIAGSTFVDHCRKQLFVPLGMDRSSFMLSDIIDMQHLALPYRWNGTSFDIPSNGHPHAPWYPGGGLRTSAWEMARFLMAIMNGGELEGEQIVAPATVDSMLTVQFPNVEFPEGEDQGLVWKLIDIDGREVWGHGGGWTRACAGMFFSPDDTTGAVMLANSGGDHTGNISDGSFFVDALLDFAARPQGTCPAVQITSTPQPVLLNPCYPNPFNPQMTISFSLERTEWAEFGVFELTGRRVTILASRAFTAGTHSLIWNGRDSQGRAMPSGTYLVRLETDSGVEARKVMLVR